MTVKASSGQPSFLESFYYDDLYPTHEKTEAWEGQGRPHAM